MEKDTYAIYSTGKELFTKKRDVYSETKASFVLSKGLNVLTIANTGIQMAQNSISMLNKVGGSALVVLPMLGPIGAVAAIGINVLCMGARIYKGEPIIPKSDKEVMLEALAETNVKIDNLNEDIRQLF